MEMEIEQQESKINDNNIDYFGLIPQKGVKIFFNTNPSNGIFYVLFMSFIIFIKNNK